ATPAEACSAPRQWHNSRAPLLGGVVEWLMAPVLKTGRAQALVGSNPTPSARIKYLSASINSRCSSRAGTRRFERSSTGGARYAPGFQSRLRGIILQSQSESFG